MAKSGTRPRGSPPELSPSSNWQTLSTSPPLLPTRMLSLDRLLRFCFSPDRLCFATLSSPALPSAFTDFVGKLNSLFLAGGCKAPNYTRHSSSFAHALTSAALSGAFTAFVGIYVTLSSPALPMAFTDFVGSALRLGPQQCPPDHLIIPSPLHPIGLVPLPLGLVKLDALLPFIAPVLTVNTTARFSLAIVKVDWHLARVS